jgi:hypothetical protein
MSIKLSAEDAGWQLRDVADEARWGAREAAWTLQERVLWRGSDASGEALRRAMPALLPLQRLIQTKLAWPLADRMDDYGIAMRTTVATVGVAAAIGAGAAGAMLAGSGESSTDPLAGPVAAAVAAQIPGTSQTLEGVAPDFVADPNPSAATEGKATAPESKAAAPPVDELGPATPPDQVAMTFAQAFVSYEVGRAGEGTAQSFRAAATKPLATALGGDPPRLPAGTKVPEAQVLNVVLGKQAGIALPASVSLVRLEAASELRLTLVETPKGWRVSEVLG